MLKSWNENAGEWIRILDSGKLSSRTFTNEEIVKTLTELPIAKILDCGCGEGWLSRSITKIGKKSIGVDATLELIESAKNKGSESYYRLTYEEIIKGKHIPENPFDAVVFNFSLYQKDNLIRLFKKIGKSITENGFLIIQTLHPFYLMEQNLPYKNQWIQDSWKGLSGDFQNGHKWYARTFESWLSVFTKSDLKLHTITEVTNQEDSPVSVIFVLKKYI